MTYITKTLTEQIRYISNTEAHKNGKVIFCGSLGLVLQNVDLGRNIGDIDMLATDNFYGNGGFLDSGRSLQYGIPFSEVFDVDGCECKSFHTLVDEKFKNHIDVFYYPNIDIHSKYNVKTIKFEDYDISVLSVDDIIDFKMNMILESESNQDIKKHVIDVLYINGVIKQKWMNKLYKSMV